MSKDRMRSAPTHRSHTQMQPRVTSALPMTRLLLLAFTIFATVLYLAHGSVVAALTAEEVQAWRLEEAPFFDWQQDGSSERASQIKIAGRGVRDLAGNLYFVGTKTYANADDGQFLGDQSMFVTRLNANDTLGWTREFSTEETDAANFVTLVNMTAADGSLEQMLYVVGSTWGYMDDGGHALNAFGHFGGRDVVLLQISLDGEKRWARQFGTTADDLGYGVQFDAAFNTLLLTGGCAADQTDLVMQMDVNAEGEMRQAFSPHEAQLMDANPRLSTHLRRYQFAVSLSVDGDILDFTMDGGVTVVPRRQRIRENGTAVGEYAVVLNRRPLGNVSILAQVVQHADPRGELVQQLAFLENEQVPTTTAAQHMLTFTSSDWNREQIVRVVAVDDDIAEGVHYATLTHSSTSEYDPNFNGPATPFLYGRDLVMQIEDDDIAGVTLSRRHLFVGEGGLSDTYTVVLRSKPWYPVEVSIIALHADQVVVSASSMLTFDTSNWSTPQTVVIAAVDDIRSETEYGGLHWGGQLAHISSSRDVRYHTRRPHCFRIPRCDPNDPTVCLRSLVESELESGDAGGEKNASDGQETVASPVRVCDIPVDCDGRQGNGVCLVSLPTETGDESIDGVIPARFGWSTLDQLLPPQAGSPSSTTGISYLAMQELLDDQALDRERVRMSQVGELSTEYEFAPPPAKIRSFVLSFLGILNLEQAQQLQRDFGRSVAATCQALVRLEMQGWHTGGNARWPDGYATVVLDATLDMFGGSVQERHLWNCGLAVFQFAAPCSTDTSVLGDDNSDSSNVTDRRESFIDVSIWDNDPGITLSTRSLQVVEGEASDTSSGTYSIVLNAPPLAASPQLKTSYCRLAASDKCGLWQIGYPHQDNTSASESLGFAAIAGSIYESPPSLLPNISIAVVGNARIAVSPSLVTFSSENWFIPQWITVRAVDNAIADGDSNLTISHRVQNSTLGYDAETPFWFHGATPTMAKLFPRWPTSSSVLLNGGPQLPYNLLPAICHSPVFQRINVAVVDNDAAGVAVSVATDDGKVHIRESDDPVDWVGDTIVSMAFSDVSRITQQEESTTNREELLRQVLVWETGASTFLKFHLPIRHTGDTGVFFHHAFLSLYETPFQIFDTATSNATSSSGTFEKSYQLRITAVENAWSRQEVRVDALTDPIGLRFISTNPMNVTATVTSSRSTSVDVTTLIEQLLATRLPVISLRVDVLADVAPLEGTHGGNMTQPAGTTHLCSSAFARQLRPSLQLAYTFPNLFLHGNATQSSTANDSTSHVRVEAWSTDTLDTTTFDSASRAVDGRRSTSASRATSALLTRSATTNEEKEPWWEITLPSLTRVGTVSISLPDEMAVASTEGPNQLIGIASLVPLDGHSLTVAVASQAGCPNACPLVQPLPIRRALVLWDVDAGVRSLRIYRVGNNDTATVLSLVQVEAYSPFLKLTPSASGVGLRARLKSDWLGAKYSHSWRLLQSIRYSQDENVARGMKTMQSSTAPEGADSALAVDGQVVSWWDPLTMAIPTSLGNEDSAILRAAADSARTEREDSPWWEVDLGDVVSVSDIILHPFVGEHGRSFCAANGQSPAFPAWTGDLSAFSQTDELLKLEDPFIQRFDVALWDESRQTVVASKTLSFSCAHGVVSVEWSNVFAAGRFVRVTLQGTGVLMLNEVQVLRWNPATKPRYLRLELRGNGDAPMALAGLKLYAPSEQTDPNGLRSQPIPFTIHSVSSQSMPTGPGAASSLLESSEVSRDCYVAGGATYVEWMILELITPTRVGLVEIDTDIQQCGEGVATVQAVSISAHGASVPLSVSDHGATAAVTPAHCILTANATLSMGNATPELLSTCSAFKCGDRTCRAQVSSSSIATTSEVVFDDFNDIIVFGVPAFAPLARLPLSQFESRALLLRDNPVSLWTFDDGAQVAGHGNTTNHTGELIRNATSSVWKATTSDDSLVLRIDETKEQTFFSNSVAEQPTMGAFSLELWMHVSTLPSSTNPWTATVATLHSGNPAHASGVLGQIAFTNDAPWGSFTLYDPASSASWVASVSPSSSAQADIVGRWLHVVAVYDPIEAAISLSVRIPAGNSDDRETISSRTPCGLTLLSQSEKFIRLGATNDKAGIIGHVRNVAWYVRSLSESEMIDHFRDFIDPSEAQTGDFGLVAEELHNTYTLRLLSQPSSPVRVHANANEDADATNVSPYTCYRFNLCNITVVPPSVTFTVDNWDQPQVIHVLATDDKLYEGLHHAQVWHVATSEPMWHVNTVVTTSNVYVRDGSLESIAPWWHDFNRVLTAYDRDYMLRRTLEHNDTVLQSRLEQLRGFHAGWSAQIVVETLESRQEYSSVLTLPSATVQIVDATVPGVQFSTASLTVSEDGRGNDYQIALLSEPTSDVKISLDAALDCFRECSPNPVCPSQGGTTGAAGALPNDAIALSCGQSESSMGRLCNITVTPITLVFTPHNWSFPQTVRVVAVDDLLDEADIHFTTIRTTSQSQDPIYDARFLPDIVVAVEDNDDSIILYSRLDVAIAEKETRAADGSTINASATYDLALLTEPWADVTLAMSNEADGTCYRSCGYPFDGADTCGLPRQQSVSSVTLRTNSPREIQEITVALPKPHVYEVQRIATYADHVDQVLRLDVTGGMVPEVVTLRFAFGTQFRTRFPTATAVDGAVIYGRTFRVTVSGSKTAGAAVTSSTSTALDGFASADQVQAALHAALAAWIETTISENAPLVLVTRQFNYTMSWLQWQVAFVRFVPNAQIFPALSVTAESSFEGTVSVVRVTTAVPPVDPILLQYGTSVGQSVQVMANATAKELQTALGALTGVYSVSVRRETATFAYGFRYMITFPSVEVYDTLSATVVAVNHTSTTMIPNPLTVAVTETQSPVRVNGAFVVHYESPLYTSNATAVTSTTTTVATPTPSPFTGTEIVKGSTTMPIAWNATASTMAQELTQLYGLGNVSVTQRRLSPEGGMEWVLVFAGNNGNLPPLRAVSLNLTGSGVTIVASTSQDGAALGDDEFVIQLGAGQYRRMDPATGHVDSIYQTMQTSTPLRLNTTSLVMKRALDTLNVTEPVSIRRVGLDCDAFSICNGYTWIITYNNSAGNVPPLSVYYLGTTGALEDTTTSRRITTLTARTVANGTYLTGEFSLTLSLLDPESKALVAEARTWNLPVNVSAVGMDEALEALRFVRSNREAEYDPETGRSRGDQFDKGVRVTREGPFLDGGHTWLLAWAIEDYVRFQELNITVHTELLTQDVEPLVVASQFALDGKPRCGEIPFARFIPDATDPFGLRGACVYDVVTEAHQKRLLCNYTVESPWIVLTQGNWCQPHPVYLAAVDDFIDEHTVQHQNITLSNVTHTVFSDDLIYSALPLKTVSVAVTSDDAAAVLVSESQLRVSEDGALVAQYELALQSEPLYNVTVVVLPWLDSDNTGCYRFGLCNLTIPVDTFVFTPWNWNLAQRVVVRATDDALDEYDEHTTGISHVSYSDDVKYDHIVIPKINVTVYDNDKSAFAVVSATTVNVTEGATVNASYDIVLRSEPFAKVTVAVRNVGTLGNLAKASPSILYFTWLNWNVSQRVTVAADDDATQDSLGSSSLMVHTLKTNDLIYAALANLTSVRVQITDNDVAGLELSTQVMNVTERAMPYVYAVRLTSEPWFPVEVIPNAAHDCYTRPDASTPAQATVCNATVLTTALYFGASNWSVWQNVSFLAFDDALEEKPVHAARITHVARSADATYTIADKGAITQALRLAITDNDVSFVNISLTAIGAAATGTTATRTQLHVAEGGFNDSYTIVLNSEPYQTVVVSLQPRLEKITPLGDTSGFTISATQIGAVYALPTTSTSSASGTTIWSTLGVGAAASSSVRPIDLVFTPLDWFQHRVLTVFAIDDEIPELATQYSSISHRVVSADARYNISNSSRGIIPVPVMISDREAIPPPLLTDAIFEAMGTKLTVTFDSIVFHAATMSVRDSSPASSNTTTTATAMYAMKFKMFACELVFSLTTSTAPGDGGVTYSLGDGATCFWRDLSTLRVELGVGATVTAGDVLALHQCAAFNTNTQACESGNVIRARSTSRAYSQGAVSVRVPADIVTPSIVLVVPESVGSCGTWKADAALSTGSGGRPYTLRQWFAVPSDFLSSAVRSALSSDTSASRAALEQSQELQVSLGSLCTAHYPATSAGTSVDDSSVAALSSADAAVVKSLLRVTTDTSVSSAYLSTQLRSACYLLAQATIATTASANELALNSSRLTPGSDVVVGLTLVNAFAQSAVRAKSILVQTLPGPAAFVVGSASQQLTRDGDSTIILRVASTLSCPQLMPTGSAVAYRWFASMALTTTLTSTDALAVDVDLNATNTANDPRVFRIPRSQLRAGYTYRFRAQAYMTSLSSSSASLPSPMTATSTSDATIVVTMLSSPLTAVITGGDASVGQRDTLVLDGTLSLDPDATATPFTYAWTCEDITSGQTTPQACVNASQGNTTALDLTKTGAVLTLTSFALQPLRSLRFSLTVSKVPTALGVASRSAMAMTMVYTLEGNRPTVSVATATTKINPARRVTLAGAVQSTYPYTVRWTQDQGDLVLPTAAATTSTTTAAAFSMPLASASNAIVPNALTPGLTYVLRLIATDVNGNSGFAIVTLVVNSPPSSGLFTVAPLTGYAMQDAFTLSCSQWTDDLDDLPLQYAFGALPTAVFDTLQMDVTMVRKRMRPLVAEQLSPVATGVTMLPPSASSADRQQVTIVAFISDAMGAVAMAHQTIEVLLPPGAKSQPVAFVSALLGDSSAVTSGDAAQQTINLLSAAMVMQNAMGATTSDGQCPGTGTDSGVCSGQGTCDPTTLQCACLSAYMGSNCEFAVEEVRVVNTDILSSLSAASAVTEPSDSGLSQQAQVIDTVLQSSTVAFDGDGVGAVTKLTSGIAKNAITLQEPTTFLSSTGSTLFGSMSTVLAVRSKSSRTTAAASASAAVAEANARAMPVDARHRRLSEEETSTTSSAAAPIDDGSGASTTNALHCADAVESASTAASFQQLVQTLQTMSAIASQGRLASEPAVQLGNGDIQALAGAGSTLTSSTSSTDATASTTELQMNLTELALACLDTELFVNAFMLADSGGTHPACTLNSSLPISRSTVFTVHSQRRITEAASATASSQRGVVTTESLTGASSCVALTGAATSAASTTARRLSSTETAWYPLVAVAIPHERPLSALEQRNFSTACRTWNQASSRWDTEVCFKDDAQSTPERTVCYCNELGTLEVLVTLEERLNFYALYPDLYRHDTPSVVGIVTMAVLLALFVVAASVGKRMDAVDLRRDKETTIKNLNRAKWSELEERTKRLNAGGEDFEAFMLRRQRHQTSRLLATGSATAATHASDAVASAVMTPLAFEAILDASVELPDENRTLFASHPRLLRHYAILTALFRGCNVLLALLGAVVVFVGIDFAFVLGNSTSSTLVLYLYGRPLGMVLIVFGGVLLLLGSVGAVVLGTKSSPLRGRRLYSTLLLALFLGELLFVTLAFHYLDDMDAVPHAALEALRSAWTSLSTHHRDEIQTTFGCCGFTSVLEADADGSTCPGEALDAIPPRTCGAIVLVHARDLFGVSFVYLQGVFLVQTAALWLVSVLLSWRALRLRQLAGQPASSVEGETTAERAMMRSLLTVVLHCSLPSLLQLHAALMIIGMAIGADLLTQLHILSNTVLAALFGVEAGAIIVAISGLHVMVALHGLVALQARHGRRLQWFVVLSSGMALLSLALWAALATVRTNLSLDPAFMDLVRDRYLRLSRVTLVDVETALVCCGFDVATEGACAVTADADTLPSCRPAIQHVLSLGLDVWTHRIALWTIAQGVVLVLATILAVRTRRFGGRAEIRPLSLVPSSGSSEKAPTPAISFTQALVSHTSFAVILLTCAAAMVLGLVLIGAGVDVIYHFNVLHVSYLLRTVDRRLGVYLAMLGGAMVAMAATGILMAWHRSRSLAQIWVLAVFALFVVLFGCAGFTFRVAHVPFSSDSAIHARLESAWVAAPAATTRVYLQNALQCCGFDKIVANKTGEVTFTHAAEVPAWMQQTTTRSSKDEETTLTASGARRRLSLSVRRIRRLTETTCPLSVDDGCAGPLATYVARVARSAFWISTGSMIAIAVVLLAVGGLFWQPQKPTELKRGITFSLLHTSLVVLCLALLLASLAVLFLGLDIVWHWSIFSSSLFQLVLTREISTACFIYAGSVFLLNAYLLQGLAIGVLHRVVVASMARVLLLLGCWLCAALAASLSRYSLSSPADWQQQLSSFLDSRWTTLTPELQHRISVDFDCCGFDDPVVVASQGIVFDRAAFGYTCSLAVSRGCHRPLEAQVSSTLSGFFVLMTALASVETATTVLGAVVVLRYLRHERVQDWFVIESRLRYAAGKYRRELSRQHVLVSLVRQYDRKLTRPQRVMALLCALTTSLAVFMAHFATHGCHRTALKACQQPNVWDYMGMALLYGGLVGWTTQCAARALFEAVRHRSDEETKEVAVTRQRKEKVLLFRQWLSLRRRPAASSPERAGNSGDGDGSRVLGGVAHVGVASLIGSHTTTEERWYAWLARLMHGVYYTTGVLLLAVGGGAATLLALMQFGYQNKLYGVTVDQGLTEAIVLALLLAATSVLAWLAMDLKQNRRNRSAVVFVLVAMASALVLTGLLGGVFLVSQTLASDPDADNWTIRNTHFSVAARLDQAWRQEGSGFFRNRVQQELQCCGFQNGTDAAFRPCPVGSTVTVEYLAELVNGTTAMRVVDEARDLEGCRDKMLARFEVVLDALVVVVAVVGVAQLLLAASALFLAYDVTMAKDAKLKLRVATTAETSDQNHQQQQAQQQQHNVQVRHTFEKVVGLKIAAPARGKLLSQMRTTSLAHVPTAVARELAGASLATAVDDDNAPANHNDKRSATSPAEPTTTESLPQTQSLALTAGGGSLSAISPSLLAASMAADRVPYPSWIPLVVFAACLVWVAAVGLVVATRSLQLGAATAWRCVAAWALGVAVHVGLVEPSAVFLWLLASTLGAWWPTTALARWIRIGRRVLRIQPSKETARTRYYASLTLYERIRFNAAVRIQRRLLTRLLRQRFLQHVREQRALAHAALQAHRRRELQHALEGFSASEVEAFRLLFEAADRAQLGLVAVAVISQSVYALGVDVAPARVRGFLHELDPAFVDLVDFEHFLYGMHRVRQSHQQELELEQAQATAAAASGSSGRGKGEELVSAAARFGPQADPQAKVRVTRQNMLRELRDQRASLAYKLRSRLAGGSTRLPPLAVPAPDVVNEATQLPTLDEEATPSGAHVQRALRRKAPLSPSKRALELLLKTKLRATAGNSASTKAATAPPPLPLPAPLVAPRSRGETMGLLVGAIHEEENSCEGEGEGGYRAAPPAITTEDPSPIEHSPTQATDLEAPTVAATGSATEDEDKGDEVTPSESVSAAGSTMTEPSESPPRAFGTYTLLTAQTTTNAGKHRAMAKLQQSQGPPPSEKAGAGAGAAQDQSPRGQDEVDAHTHAKSKLEKAFKKKKLPPPKG